MSSKLKYMAYGGVATEINTVNYVSSRSWLTSWHWAQGFFILVGYSTMLAVRRK